MQVSEWNERSGRLLTSHEKLAALSVEDLRQALWEAHRLFTAAPNPVQQAFRELSEEVLVMEAGRRADVLTSGDMTAYGSAPVPGQAPALAMAAHVRALDEMLLTSVTSFGPVLDPLTWMTRDGEAFVLPRYRGRPAASTSGGDGRTFSRRGTLHHRVLPAELRGYRVSLVLNGDVSPAPVEQAADPLMGAALFEGLTLTPLTVEGGFRIEGARCDDAHGMVARQVDAARREGCFAVVWPELTVPADVREQIEAKLRNGLLEQHEGPALQVVVTGSWHEVQPGGGYKNVGSVLDGYGRFKLRFEKLIPYPDKKLGREAIVYGQELKILVTDEHLIAFAVCRDFCDLGLTLPYPELDVDLVLVPSYGDEKTMNGHRHTAMKLGVVHGTRTFVVQQREILAERSEELGWVLACPLDPLGVELAELRQNVGWRTYPWRTTFHSG